MAKLYIKNTDGTYSPYQPVAVLNLDIVQATGSSLTSAMSQKAVTDELAKKQDNISDLADIKDGAALGKTALQEESDPTVPSWAKAATKPTYTAAEVGALPSDTEYVKKIELDTVLGNISVYKSDGSSTNTAIIAESALKLNKTCKIEFNGSFNNIIGFDGSEENYFIDTTHSHPEYVIEDIDAIRSGASKGATALQSYTETDPVYTADKPNLATKAELEAKQDALVSGTSIKTINGTSLLGSGDISVGSDVSVIDNLTSTSTTAALSANQGKVLNDSKQATLVSGTNIKTINSTSLLGSGDITTNDTKNTAGSTNTSSKIFLIGATSQASNPQTYSHDTAYVGTDGCLYSNSAKTLTELTRTVTSATSVTLDDTKYYVISCGSGLTLTLPDGYATDGKEYMCELVIGTEVPVLSLPSDIKFAGGKAPSEILAADTRCQLSIQNGLAVIVSFA